MAPALQFIAFAEAALLLLPFEKDMTRRAMRHRRAAPRGAVFLCSGRVPTPLKIGAWELPPPSKSTPKSIASVLLSKPNLKMNGLKKELNGLIKAREKLLLEAQRKARDGR